MFESTRRPSRSMRRATNGRSWRAARARRSATAVAFAASAASAPGERLPARRARRTTTIAATAIRDGDQTHQGERDDHAVSLADPPRPGFFAGSHRP